MIELLAALVLLAVLTSTVTLSFEAPLRRQKAQDTLAAIRQFDADARAASVADKEPIPHRLGSLGELAVARG